MKEKLIGIKGETDTSTIAGNINILLSRADRKIRDQQGNVELEHFIQRDIISSLGQST